MAVEEAVIPVVEDVQVEVLQEVLTPAQQLVHGALSVEPYELAPLSAFSGGGTELWSPSGLVMAVTIFLAARAGRQTAILDVRQTSLDRLSALQSELLSRVEQEKLKSDRDAAAAAAAAEAALSPEERVKRQREREAEAARIAEEAAARRVAQEKQAQAERLIIQVRGARCGMSTPPLPHLPSNLPQVASRNPLRSLLLSTHVPLPASSLPHDLPSLRRSRRPRPPRGRPGASSSRRSSRNGTRSSGQSAKRQTARRAAGAPARPLLPPPRPVLT